MATNRDRVLQQIRENPGLTDTEIRERTGISRHQQVNSICRALATRGITIRETDHVGRIRNRLADHARAVESTEFAPRVDEPAKRAIGEPTLLPPFDPATTVLIVPCSAGKAGITTTGATSTINDHLAPDLRGSSPLHEPRIEM